MTTNLWRVFEETRDAYLNEHPGPQVIDFSCPRCKAQPGEQCRKPSGVPSARFHIPRQDRYARAFTRWQAAASDAADAAYNAAAAAEERTSR
jgi:hypothetical protein